MLHLAFVLVLVPQDPAPATPAASSFTVTLAPAPAAELAKLRWSPKAASVPLVPRDGTLAGEFGLGPADAPRVAVRLHQRPGSEHFDQLFVDADRDGKLSATEGLVATPKLQNGKWWSSFSTEIAIPLPPDVSGQAVASRSYPLALWYVEDPQEPTAKPALRWTRRGYVTGKTSLAGKEVHVLVTEMVLDGNFDQRDAWAIARDQAGLFAVPATSLEKHLWLDGVAWRATAIDAHGRSLRCERFDPGISEAEEKAKADIYKADREAPRAAQPLAFGADLAAALAEAKRTGKRVFLDFQTTWCGPCRQMEQMVYTADAVVHAAADLLAVKLDGDRERALVKQYEVAAYPTLLLLDADGKELRRAVGYRGVAAMVEFFKPDAKR